MNMLTLEQIVSIHEKDQILPWTKLNKSLKLKRMMDFAEELRIKDELDEERTEQLKTSFFRKAIKILAHLKLNS